MSTIDYIILVPMAFGLIRGLMNGLVQELTTLVALVLGVLGAKHWSPILAMRLCESFEITPQIATAIAYSAILFGITVGLAFVGKLLSRILSAVSLGGLNRLFGALFGAVKWTLIVGACFALLEMVNDKFPILKPEAKQASVLYQPLLDFCGVVFDSFVN